MSDDYQQRVLRVLADPTRYRIAQLTCEAPQPPRGIARLLGLTSSAVYQHLNALLEAGFIERVEVENRVHYKARAGFPVFLQRFGEACADLQKGTIEAMPRLEAVPPERGIPSTQPEASAQGGMLNRFRSSFLAYYSYSPFWSFVVAAVALVDAVLAVWCLVYAVFLSPNPVLTVVGGLIVCGSLAGIANYLYQRTKPPPSPGKGGVV